MSRAIELTRALCLHTLKAGQAMQGVTQLQGLAEARRMSGAVLLARALCLLDMLKASRACCVVGSW